ncbi:MAG: hypothetical protein HYY20_11030 [Candidatus Tectomicrobia bacterium]|uniref:Uncharacterized protein n=1 Tax=Tectimicrobiota bacterium TaxID=2528274 RepID=A0A932G1M1_UNCTE|nr:hypothetical protein [Candidatus Tectomicrobia bacterium]
MKEATATQGSGWRRGLVMISLAVGFILLTLYSKVYLSSRSEYRQAVEASQRQEVKAAITHYQRSIQWYAPGNGYVAHSAQGLWEIGRRAEGRDDRELALEAYRALRSGILSTRSLYTPHAGWVERCNERIAALEAARKPVYSIDQGKSLAQRKAERLQLLRKTHAPNPFWSFVLEVGFLGWIGGAVGFIFQAITEEGALHRRKALAWGGLVAVCYALWVVGMTLA